MADVHDEVGHHVGGHVVGDGTDAEDDEGGDGDDGDAGARDGALAVLGRHALVEVDGFEASQNATSEHLGYIIVYLIREG